MHFQKVHELLAQVHELLPNVHELFESASKVHQKCKSASKVHQIFGTFLTWDLHVMFLDLYRCLPVNTKRSYYCFV